MARVSSIMLPPPARVGHKPVTTAADGRARPKGSDVLEVSDV